MKFPLPDAALGQHIAILGKTGSGKSTTAKGCVEHIVKTMSGARVCVLDPIKSDWWGLTSSADGAHAGLPFHILGGPHGHVPLHPSSGKAIGELVGTGALPLSIVDMADFPAGGLSQFFNDFAPALMRNARGVVYLILEEAHEFAPKERAGVGAETMAIYNAKKLATAGRSKGIRLVVLTQRTQALHNALLGSCDTMVAHRLTAPADQDPVKAWLKAHVDKTTFEKVAGSLASLPTGSAWVCSGEANLADMIAFPRITTFDNSATPTIGGAERKVTMAPVDQAKLRAIIGDAVAEAEANDPATLRVRIKALEAEVARKPGPAVDDGALLRERQAGFESGLAKGAEDQRITDQKTVRDWLQSLPGPELPATVHKSSPTPGVTHRPTPYVPAPARPAARATGPGEAIPRGEKACLICIAQQPNGATREQLTVITGYKRSSRDAYIQRLREKGYVDPQGDRLLPTAEGVAALGADYEPMPTGVALREFHLQRLPEGERRVLEMLISAYPGQVARDEIDKATNYKRSSRDAYLQRLSARQLIATVGRGEVRASEELFS
jgi:hypothetical protein